MIEDLGLRISDFGLKIDIQGARMNDELADEYDLYYANAKPNRFAEGMQAGGRLVVLEPEVAAAFRESKTVNDVLKALLKTMPPSPPPAQDAA